MAGQVKVTGKKIVIEDTMTAGKLSKSGKSYLVASSNGFLDVEGTDLRVSYNVIKKV